VLGRGVICGGGHACATEEEVVADLVGYRQHAIWLSRDELTKLIHGLRAAILPVLDNQPDGNRARYLLSPILFPTAEPPDDNA
jgi:hypothetical protein